MQQASFLIDLQPAPLSLIRDQMRCLRWVIRKLQESGDDRLQ
jgi:hypothetical protein